MSYKCTLTFLNQAERKKKIIDMYNVALYTKGVECYCVVLMWMFEFICSYFYIDMNEDVTLKRLIREQSLSSDDYKLLKIWADFRNEVAHCVFPLNVQRLKRLSDCQLGGLFKNFEDDEEMFKRIFRECCKQILDSMIDNHDLQESHVFG